MLQPDAAFRGLFSFMSIFYVTVGFTCLFIKSRTNYKHKEWYSNRDFSGGVSYWMYFNGYNADNLLIHWK